MNELETATSRFKMKFAFEVEEALRLDGIEKEMLMSCIACAYPTKAALQLPKVCDFNVKVEFKAFHIGLKHVGEELAKYNSSR